MTYQCDQCSSKEIQRQFYVWRSEHLDDPDAFDLDGAEPTDMGADWWCPQCEDHTFGEECKDDAT